MAVTLTEPGGVEGVDRRRAVLLLIGLVAVLAVLACVLVLVVGRVWGHEIGWCRWEARREGVIVETNHGRDLVDWNDLTAGQRERVSCDGYPHLDEP